MAEALIYREFVLRGHGAWSALCAFIKANAADCLRKGKPIRLIVTQDEKKRTSAMNRRYWGPVLKQIAEQAWVDGRQHKAEVWHEHFARTFGFLDEVVLPYGEIVTKRKSTTDMTVTEFSEYMANVEAFAAQELGVEFDL